MAWLRRQVRANVMSDELDDIGEFEGISDDEAERDKMRGNNVVSHTSYSIYLGSEVTPGRPITLPPERVHIPHPKQGVVAETRPSESSRWPACSYQPWFQSRESYKASSKSSSDPA